MTTRNKLRERTAWDWQVLADLAAVEANQAIRDGDHARAVRLCRQSVLALDIARLKREMEKGHEHK